MTRNVYGWVVVAAVFVMAMFSFGLGFYGVTVYVAALQRLQGWSASTVSAPVTVYYVAGALLTMMIGGVYERLGPRLVVAGGSLALTAGVAGLGVVTQPWQLYPVFLVMSLGWGAMSGAAINIIVAPWWEERRGLAISIAFNGATTGGVIVAPVLIPLIEALGFARALTVVAAGSVVLLLAAAASMRRPPREPAAHRGDQSSARGNAVRTWRFWSASAPFALGLAAQVGLLTHLVTLVTPTLGVAGAARAVSATTATAMIGRLLTGAVVDRVGPRRAACVTLIVQILGVVVLARSSAPAMIYAGCVLFGLGVGNLTTLPGLVLAAEWPRSRFAALVALAVGINQLTFAFGPSLVGVIRDRAGSYAPALAACATLQALAAILVVLGPGRAERPA